MGARKLSYYEEKSVIPITIGITLFSREDGGTRFFTTNQNNSNDN
jgi:hypothetical protein